jgi:hypothetical protein
MGRDTHRDDVQAAAIGLASSLAQKNQSAGIYLARLILADMADEGSAYRLFTRALTHQLRQWPGKLATIQGDDVIRMMRGAARELISEDWDD